MLREGYGTQNFQYQARFIITPINNPPITITIIRILCTGLRRYMQDYRLYNLVLMDNTCITDSPHLPEGACAY